MRCPRLQGKGAGGWGRKVSLGCDFLPLCLENRAPLSPGPLMGAQALCFSHLGSDFDPGSQL